MADEDLTLRMRTRGFRQGSRDVDGSSRSVRRWGGETSRASKGGSRLHGVVGLLNGRMRAGIGIISNNAAALGIAGFAGSAGFAINAASDLNEEVNKASVIFGKSRRSILNWSKTTAEGLGLSRTEALSAAGNFGGFFKVAGKGQRDAANLSKRMVTLAGDMASFSNTTPEDALEALRSGLSGEVEPLRRYRVFLSDAAVQQEGIRMGLQKTKGHLTDNQKIMARYGIIMKQTKDSQGDFARTSGGLANQQRILRAEVTNLAAELGTSLLPIAQKVTHGLVEFIKGFRNGTGAGGQFKQTIIDTAHTLQNLWGWVKDNRNELLALAGGITGAVLAFRAFMIIQQIIRLVKIARGLYIGWRAGVLALTFAQYGLNTALVANPIGIVVALLAGLAIGLYILWKRSDTFREKVKSLWETLKGAPSGIWEGIKSGLTSTINFIIDQINGLISGINKLPGVDIGTIGHVGGFQAPAGPKGPGYATGSYGAPPAATGGVVNRPGMVEVGERGRERLWLPQGAQVQPLPATSGGGDTWIAATFITPEGEVTARQVVKASRKRKGLR